MGTRGTRSFWTNPLSFEVTESYNEEQRLSDCINIDAIASSGWFKRFQKKYGDREMFDDRFFYCYVRVDDFIPFGTAQFDQGSKEPTVAIDVGMKEEWEKDPDWFTAVLIHELVHSADARYGSEELSNMIYDEEAEAPIEDLPKGVEWGTPFDAEYFYKKTEMNAFQAQAAYLLSLGRTKEQLHQEFENHYLTNEKYRKQFNLWFNCVMDRLSRNEWEK